MRARPRTSCNLSEGSSGSRDPTVTGSAPFLVRKTVEAGSFAAGDHLRMDCREARC